MKQKIVVVIFCMMILGYVVFPKKEDPIYVNQEAVAIHPMEVHIEGEVHLPGTYYVFEETTVYDLIVLAGGVTSIADTSSISYNRIINQSTTINIPSIENDHLPVVTLVNVNEASFGELINVPYISESMAAYLIMYRESHGYFQSLDELIHVKYIGAATLEKIKPYLKLS